MFFIHASDFYLFLTLPFLLVWVVLYLWNKRTRYEQLLLSIVGAIVGPLSEIIYTRDYWAPQSVFPLQFGNFVLMPEDILFGFAIGGIAAVIFEVVFRTRQRKIHVQNRYTSIWIVILFFSALWLLLQIGLNSIYASGAAFVITALPMFWWRRDLLVDAIGSGVGVTVVLFVCYTLVFSLTSNMDLLIKEGWLLHETVLGGRLLGIPVTELTWAFTIGFLVGPLYEFSRGKKLLRVS